MEENYMKNKNTIKVLIIGLCAMIISVIYMVALPERNEEIARLESEKSDLSANIEDTKSEILGTKLSYKNRCKQVYEIMSEDAEYKIIVEDNEGNMFWFGK